MAYVQNRPFYEGRDIIVVQEETTITFDDSNNNYYESSGGYLSLETRYYVEWDGIEYAALPTFSDFDMNYCFDVIINGETV
jgi:hypothetical protein